MKALSNKINKSKFDNIFRFNVFNSMHNAIHTLDALKAHHCHDPIVARCILLVNWRVHALVRRRTCLGKYGLNQIKDRQFRWYFLLSTSCTSPTTQRKNVLICALCVLWHILRISICVANDVVFVRTNTASRIDEWVCLMTNDEGGRGQQNINGRDYRLTIKKIQPNEYFGLSCTFFFWRFACWEWIVPKLDGINKHVLGADLVLEAGRYIFYIIKYTAGVCLLLIGGKCA